VSRVADIRVAGDSPARFDRILRLALNLSGAAYAQIARADGCILAEAGAPPAGADRGGLAAFALAQAEPLSTSDAAADPRLGAAAPAGVRLLGAAPVRTEQGELLGALAIAAGEPRPAPAHLPGTLADLAALAAQGLREARSERDEREALLAEVDHRVKNVLAAVQSMAAQSARRAVSLDGFLKTFVGRLRAMASAQELLTATRWRGASIHDLATATLSTLAPGQTRWEGPDLFLTPRAANALALALHELAVNAVRHGALSTDSGAVDLHWRPGPGGGFEIDWVESGGPRVNPPSARGFGTLLLEEVTGRELDGEVTSDYRTSGLRVRITGSAKALAEPPGGAMRAAAPPPAPGASQGAPPPVKTSTVEGMKVIIVEDAVLLAMELEAGLEEAGAKVLGSAALVEEAMQLVDLPIDAAVLDCNLNGFSVEPVAEALARRGVPFVFATGYGESRGAPEGFDAPIIRKPYDVAQIAAALAQLTGRA
jgi:two-component sensor histidine kinase/CheY-like chemotaxis protein